MSKPLMHSRAEAWEEADLLYPEEDDTPVDNIFSEKQQRLLTESLETCWPGPGKGRPFEVMANVGLYYSPYEQPVVPDVMLSLDVRHPEDIQSQGCRAYSIWKYGKPPEIAIEIVSNLKGHEAGGKMSDYAQAGVRYYAIFDPEQYLHKRILRLYELHGAGYIEMVRQQFPEIGLGLTVWNGVYIEREDTWLRWCDRNGKLIATGIESNALKDQRAEREKQRAEQRAEQEKREKQQAEQSVARLKEKLREMGIDPKEI